MSQRGLRMIIASGGSGGHIFPAISLGRALKKAGAFAEIVYVGSKKDLDRRIFTKEGVEFTLLSANKLPYKISAHLAVFVVKLLFDAARSLFIILRRKPDVVVGFGGYVSFPVLALAHIFGIPKVVHEQNVVPGRANKALFAIADKIAISFDDTRRYLGPAAEKAVFCGNPIRTDICSLGKRDAVKRFGLDEKKFTILVIGGSQGAHVLNGTFINAIALMDREAKNSIQVLHITGVKDYEWASAAYADAGVDHRVYSFIDKIDEAYGASDLVVTRSGSSALFELAFLGKPMVLVPYPFAMSHQADNAAVFAGKAAAKVLEEKSMSAEILKNAIMNLVNDKGALEAMSSAAKAMAVGDASDRLAREALSVARRDRRDA